MENLIIGDVTLTDDPKDGGFKIWLKTVDGVDRCVCKIYSSGEIQIHEWITKKIALEGAKLCELIGP